MQGYTSYVSNPFVIPNHISQKHYFTISFDCLRENFQNGKFNKPDSALKKRSSFNAAADESSFSCEEVFEQLNRIHILERSGTQLDRVFRMKPEAVDLAKLNIIELTQI